MDPMAEEQLDYGDEHHHPAAGAAGGAIPAIADDDDEFDDLYNDVNVGDHFSSLHQNPNPTNPNPILNPTPNPTPPSVPDQNPNFNNPRVQSFQQESNKGHVGNMGFQAAKAPIAPAPASRPAVGPVDVNGPTMLFVGELHWWTTDADLESVLTQYGRVKEIKFFDERASGKSKGYCQVEFFDAAAASACKEGMDGYEFNGRACVVAFASPQTLRQMGASYVNRNQNQGQMQQQQGGRRGLMNEGMGRGGNGGDNGGGRGFSRGGWGGGRGQGMMGRGQGGGMRGRGFAVGKNVMGNNVPYGQAITGPPAGIMHPQNMMGAGFDPTFMSRGGPFGGFGGPAFTGMMPPFQAMNAVGLPGVAPHVNLAFFGRGMPTNGMGVMGGGGGMEGQMWSDGGMGGGWTGDDDGASEYGYGEGNNERVGRSNPSREKERGSEHEFSGNSDKRHRDEKEHDWDRSDRERHRDEKDGYRDYRPRDRDYDNEVDWDRGQSSSRSRSKSWMPEDDHRSRSRDGDYGKEYGKRRRE